MARFIALAADLYEIDRREKKHLPNRHSQSRMHRAIEGCARVYFGMSVSADDLTATVNTAAVARHHGVEVFVNMSLAADLATAESALVRAGKSRAG